MQRAHTAPPRRPPARTHARTWHGQHLRGRVLAQHGAQQALRQVRVAAVGVPVPAGVPWVPRVRARDVCGVCACGVRVWYVRVWWACVTRAAEVRQARPRTHASSSATQRTTHAHTRHGDTTAPHAPAVAQCHGQLVWRQAPHHALQRAQRSAGAARLPPQHLQQAPWVAQLEGQARGRGIVAVLRCGCVFQGVCVCLGVRLGRWQASVRVAFWVGAERVSACGEHAAALRRTHNAPRVRC
jgi:hypothetical protein